MRARLRTAWLSRAPRDRAIIAALAVLIGVAMYVALLGSAGRARAQLRPVVSAMRMQASLVEQHAGELEQLRASPPLSASRTDLRTLVQAQADASGLSRALVRIDAPDANQVVVVFGAVGFADWLNWIADLKAQHIRLDTCRLEALSTPGLVSVTATLLRPSIR